MRIPISTTRVSADAARPSQRICSRTRVGSRCPVTTAKEAAFAESMKKQATDVRFLDRKAYAAWLKQNDDLNLQLSKDLGLLKR